MERVNCFYCPAGRRPFRGWVLLPRREYVQLNTYSTSLQLNIGDTAKPDNVATLKNLAIVQARCVTRGLAADLDALYLVELTDARGVLHNRWFKQPLTEWYNVRSPAYPGQFHESSMNGASAWTWTTMLQNIWTSLPLLGAWPGLPTAPTGTPEGWWFPGVPGWHALCDVLDHLGLSVACDLTKAAPYTIVSGGASDAAFDALTAKYVTNLEDDLEWIDTGSGRVPATVKVFFRRRNEFYGSEETVRRDTLQWSTDAVYTVSVAAPAAFSTAAGTGYLWDDFTVRYDMNGNPVAADEATAATIAAERVTQYFAKVYDATLGYMTRTYAGALPFVTGSRIDGVKWWMDSGRRYGWRTQLVRGELWPEVQE